MNISKQNKLMIYSFIITVIVIFYRRPDSFLNPQFWGEEGTIFFSEAYHYGFKSLFNTCAGYFHLFPRLIACISISIHLPLEIIPIVFCYSWLAILFIIIYFIWKRLPLNDIQKFFISISLVLIPLQSEVIMNLTNIQWIMSLFPLIIFSSNNLDRNKKWFYLDFFVLILAGLTGPNFTVLLPLFLVLLVLQKDNFKVDKKRLLLYIVAIFFGLVGVFSLIHHGSVNRVDGEFILFNSGFVQYLFVQYAFLFIGKFAFKLAFILMLVGVITVAGFMIYVFKKSLRFKENNFIFITLIAGLLFIVTTLIAYRNEPSMLSPYYRGVRNFYIPAITFVWLLIVSISKFKFGTIALVFLNFLFLIELILFVGRFRFDDFELKKYSNKIEISDTLSIPVNPAGWYIHIDNRIKLNK